MEEKNGKLHLIKIQCFSDQSFSNLLKYLCLILSKIIYYALAFSETITIKDIHSSLGLNNFLQLQITKHIYVDKTNVLVLLIFSLHWFTNKKTHSTHS